jgi:uncharacterized protein YdcH (DUF465 family)
LRAVNGVPLAPGPEVDKARALACHGIDADEASCMAHHRSRQPVPKEAPMFPEYRQLITQLKSENAHFSALFQRHNDLDQEIKNMEDGIVPSSGTNIEVLKKEKLQLKDKLYGLLKAADQNGS